MTSNKQKGYKKSLNFEEHQMFDEELSKIYLKSRIFSQDSKDIFHSMATYNSICETISIPYTQDFLCRVLYYYLLEVAFSYNDPKAQSSVYELIDMVLRYNEKFKQPASITNNHLNLSNKEIQQYTLRSIAIIKIKKQKIHRIANKTLSIDYIFMTIFHTLINHFGSAKKLFEEIDMTNFQFKQNKIKFEGYTVNLKYLESTVQFRIQKDKQFIGFLSNCSLHQSVEIKQQSKNKKNNHMEFKILKSVRQAESFIAQEQSFVDYNYSLTNKSAQNDLRSGETSLRLLDDYESSYSFTSYNIQKSRELSDKSNRITPQNKLKQLSIVSSVSETCTPNLFSTAKTQITNSQQKMEINQKFSSKKRFIKQFFKKGLSENHEQ